MAERDMVRIKNGAIIEGELPEAGELSDGRTVSNYHLLDDDVLRSEGWVTVTDPGPPTNFDPKLVVRHTRDVALKGGRPVAVYTPVTAPPHLEVDADNVVTVYTADLDAVTFEIVGDETSQVTVAVTDGRAELAVTSETPGSVTIRAVELEEEVEVAV